MKSSHIVFSLFLIATSLGAEPFKGQPNIHGALNKTNAAEDHLKKARGGEDPQKNLGKASELLASARKLMDEANKNKGTYRLKAVQLIEQAKLEVDAALTDPVRAQKAELLIKEAREQIVKAGETGRP